MEQEKEIIVETLTDEEVKIVFALRNKHFRNLLLSKKLESIYMQDKSHQITSEETSH